MSNKTENASNNKLFGLLRRISLPVRLGLLAGVGALGVSVLSIIDRDASHDAQDSVSSQLNLTRDTRILKQALHASVHDFDLEELDRLTNIYLENSDTDALAVYSAGGERWVSFGDVDEIESDPEILALLNSSGGTLNKQDQLYVVSPFLHGSEVEAVLLVSAHEKYGVSKTRETLWRPMIQNTLAALIIALLVHLYARRMEAPIETLRAQLRHIKPGASDKALEKLTETDPEIAENIAEMVGRFEATIFTHQRAAITDPASGLMNRLHFMKLVDEKIAQYGERAVVLGLIDVYRFRRINDHIGVKRADELLLQIGRRLRDNVDIADRTLRSEMSATAPTLIGRLSGVQFGILVPMADQSLARDMLQTIVSGFAHPFDIAGRSIELSITAAAASSPKDAQTGPELIKQAETALQRAKKDKQTAPFFYNQTMADEASAQMRFEDEVRQGVENGEFVAVFQPKVELESGRVIGAEALARWRRSDGSVVSPGRFIPVAEELGLISKLGVSVLRDACLEASRWNRNGENLCVAVNVSPHQFEDSDFIPAIYESLEESGLSPELLELEITESVAVEDPEKVARVMRPLRARGVRLAIDDFGTGHSNFTTLTRLPFDVFKIDQQFVRALSKDPHAPAIIEMILAMAEALGLETVAEGVETTEQFEFLKMRNCTIGQGYHFSPPLPGHEFSTFLKHWKSNPATPRLSGAA